MFQAVPATVHSFSVTACRDCRWQTASGCAKEGFVYYQGLTESEKVLDFCVGPKMA